MSFAKLFKIFMKINLGIAHITAMMIIVMMVITAVNVALRYVFKSPLEWPLEVCEYIMVACAILPATYTLLEKKHIAVDIIYNYFAPKHRLWMDIVTSVMGFIYAIALTWQSGILSLRCYENNWLSETGTDIPLLPSYAVVTIGAFLLCLGFIAIVAERILQLKKYNINGGLESSVVP